MRSSSETTQTGPLTIYFKEIADCKGLSAVEEASLTARIRNNDHKAFEKMVSANLRFVVKVAMHYQHLGMELSDLISAGNMGLMEAARRFDESRNFKFVSYAVWWIRQSILKALAEQSHTVAIPLSRAALLYKIAAAEKRLEQHLGRLPDADEVAQELGVERKDVDDTIAAFTGQSSMDTALDEQENTTLHDVLPDEKQDIEATAIMRSMLAQLKYALNKLDSREKTVVQLYYGINCGAPAPLREIGQTCRVSGERARQLCTHAVKKMRRYCIERRR